MSRLWVVVLVLASLASQAVARTIRVPSEVSTIRRAAFEAVEGDTISVAPGTYVDRFSIFDKNIVLRGEMGAEATIIDGSLAAGNVITLGSTITNTVDRRTIIEDLTIRGGSFNSVAPESTGAAIYVNRSRPTIQRCRLIENDGNAAGGLAAYFFSQPLVQDCWVAYNGGGGIFIETDTGDPGPAAEIRNTFVVRNQGYGVLVIKGGRAHIESSTIAYNAGDGVASEITQGSTAAQCYVTVKNSLVTHNAGGGIVRGRTLGVCYTLECNDVYDNAGGAYVRSNSGDPCFPGRGQGDVSIDPLYRNAAADDFLLADESPLFSLCIPGSCGALGAGNSCSTAVTPSSWTRVKTLYR